MAKIKLYRGIGADTKEELEKYIKDFYNINIKAHGYGGGGNLGDGIYFTTDKDEAIAYSKHNDYKDWKYSHVFEVEVDTNDFLPTNKINYDKMLELDSEYKRLNELMRTGRGEDVYSDFIQAEDRALKKYVESQNKKGVMDGNVFSVQTKEAILHNEISNKIVSEATSKVLKSSNYWDKRALKRLSDAEKHSEVYINRVKRIYEQAYKDIDRELASIYKNYSKDTGLDTQKLKELLTKSETKKTWEQMKKQGLDKYVKDNYKSRISRLEQLKAQIYAKAKEIYPKEDLEQTMCYKGVIHNSYYKTMYDTQMGTGYDFNFSTLDPHTVDVLMSDPWSGKNYSERIWGNTDILADSLSETLGGAMLSGQSMSKTAKQIRDRFNVAEYQAERLIRTETNHFNNEVDAMAFEEIGLDKYVFVATLDSRTSEICQAMDNKVFKFSEREDGVNYPPLHPNCRSKVRAYLGEDEEKNLQRRARNPITGKTELIKNMSYKDWIKQYENGENNKKTVKNDTKTTENAQKTTKTVQKPTKNWVKADNLPAWFKDYKGNADEEGKLLSEWLNKNGNPNSKASKIFSESTKGMGFSNDLSKNTYVKYKEGKGSFIQNRYSNTLEYPKITNKENPTGTIQTILHENWHAIDYYKGSESFLSTARDSLKDVVKKDDGVIGKDVEKLFKEFNDKCSETSKRVVEENKYLYTEINKKYDSGKFKNYSSYKSAWSKATSKIRGLVDYEERNLMGGGINNLQDIYDSLSGGYFKDSGIVKYGHGTRYFRKGGVNSQVKEIVANYGALSMTRPDLVKLLKADKPNLVKELEALLESMEG